MFRRPSPGVGYLEALSASNSRVVFDPISRVTEKGIQLKTGELIELDVIVCATGFDVSWRPRFPVVGRNGLDLAEHWKDRPLAYLSFSIPAFPNYFGTLFPPAKL
jgi:cation diffusion facilitator CzcD-associated flavoprotein CzcO